ncbi:MAG: STAS domain-containing protein [Ruminococcaceae bacterium]|nr:STAS domain-containing protein [Oscillospiraceae bacterium]
MAVSCISDSRELSAVLTGELDHHSAKQVMEELDRRMERELPRRLTIDMGGVTFMDSSGIAVVLRAHRRMAQLQGSVTVTNVPQQAKRVFQAAGLHRIITFL